MEMTLGALMMGKHKKADLEKIHAEARDQQKKAQKRGMWSALGGTLGSSLVPLLFGTTMGPMGGMAAKMLMGRIGRELGEEAGPKVDYGAIEKAGDYGFKGHEELRKDYTEGLKEARDTLNQQQWSQSFVNPIQEMGMAEAGKMASEWAGGTKLGKGYQEYVDKGGVFGGEGSKLSQAGDYLASYMPKFLKQASNNTQGEYGEVINEYGTPESYYDEEDR